MALKEIGEIEPWFDKRFNAWIFSHKKYPDVEYAGDAKEEVILAQFHGFEHSLLSPDIEESTTKNANWIKYFACGKIGLYSFTVLL